MRLNILLFVVLSMMQTGEHLKIKEHPVFGQKIEGRELQIITNEYFKLSARNNIHFDRNVTMGFSKINSSKVIGTCTFGSDFREIDIDSEYWKAAKWPTKVALVFHELTHCYCTRPHDFGDGTMYPDGSIRWIIQRIMLKQPFTPLRPAGFMDDNCPQSIMYPEVLSNTCFKKHYSYYVQEMFSRCKAW